jgi:putative alpha-1,2-mannosidase
MSAWYIFSALGFYPVDTVGGDYVFGAPQIPEAVIKLPDGKKFTMKARGLSDVNKYVKAVKIDGIPVTDGRIRYDQIMAGCTLEFEMGPERD